MFLRMRQNSFWVMVILNVLQVGKFLLWILADVDDTDVEMEIVTRVVKIAIVLLVLCVMQTAVFAIRQKLLAEMVMWMHPVVLAFVIRDMRDRIVPGALKDTKEMETFVSHVGNVLLLRKMVATKLPA